MHKMQAAFFLPLYAPARQNLPGTARTPPGLAPAKIFFENRVFENGRNPENSGEFESVRSLNRKNRILGIDEPPPVCYNHTCAKRRGALPRFTISGTGPKTALPRRFGNKMEVYTMSTTLAKPAEMADRKWYVIDELS